MLHRPPQTCGRGPFRREGEEETRCQSHSAVPRRQLLPLWAGQTRPWWGSRRPPQADRQADEPFCFLWVQFPCHRRKIPIAKHPGSQVPHSGQLKRRPRSKHLVGKSPGDLKTQVFRFQYCSGFSSLFLYNHKLLQSRDDSQFYKPGTYHWYDFVYALVHCPCPNEGRTSLVGPCSHRWPWEDMSAPLTSLCCCVCGKALSFLKSLKSLRCHMEGVQCKRLPRNCEPFCKLEAFLLLLLLFLGSFKFRAAKAFQ